MRASALRVVTLHFMGSLRSTISLSERSVTLRTWRGLRMPCSASGVRPSHWLGWRRARRPFGGTRHRRRLLVEGMRARPRTRARRSGVRPRERWRGPSSHTDGAREAGVRRCGGHTRPCHMALSHGPGHTALPHGPGHTAPSHGPGHTSFFLEDLPSTFLRCESMYM